MLYSQIFLNPTGTVTAVADRAGTSTPPAPAADGVLPCASLVGATDERITLMGLLVETHARLTRVLGAEMETASGLPLTWFDVMVRIRRTPEGFLTMSRLAGEVSLTTGGITRLVDRIEEAGYLARRTCATDRRSVHVTLTPSGEAKLTEAVAAHLEGLQRHLVDPLEPDERAALESALRKLRGPGPVCGG